MKLTIERTQLAAALKRAGRVATKSSTLPILGCVLLTAAPGSLSVVANNLDVALSLSLGCPDVVEPGTLAVCCSRLAAAVDRLSGAVLGLELKKSMLHISGEGAEVRLAVLSAEEFPAIAKVKQGEAFPCEFEGLSSAVSRVLFAVSKDASRYVLNGVFFDGATSRVVATDGRRLAAMTLGQLGAKVSAIVPADALKLLLSMPESKSVEVNFGESMASFVCETWSVFCKLIEGNFPNYQQVIPKPSWRVLTVSRAQILKALPLMSTVMESKSNAVRLVGVSEESLRLESSGAEVGECEATIPGEVPEGFRAAFDVGFFSEMLSAVRGDEIAMDMDDEASPALVTDGDFAAVLMPMRIS